MRYDARDKSKRKENSRIAVRFLGEDFLRGDVVACDTEEGWYEQFQFEKTPKGKLMPKCTPWVRQSNGSKSRSICPPIRVYAPFDVVDKVTGMTLHQVRESKG